VKAALVAILLVLSASCSKSSGPARGVLAILRFENLTGDASLDWMARGAARQIGFQLEGVLVADSPQPSGEREQAIAAGAGRILYGYVSKNGDRLRLRAEMEDAASRKFAKSAEASGPLSAGLVPLANAVSRQLDPAARPLGAKNEAALSTFVAGLNASDAPAAIDALSRSIAADPDFGAAYLALLQFSLGRQDRASAEKFLALARARGDAIPAVDRAKLDVFAAQLAGDTAAVAQSLGALSKLTPTDPSLLRTLANTELAAKRYAAAIEYLKKALELQPGDPTLLNTLGYTRAYAGDLDGAVATLREYERVLPKDANPLDSIAEVHFYFGRFSEAEKLYRQAYERDPNFQNAGPLIRSALARLMTGDVSGSETIFSEYERVRRAANDPVIEFTRARWDFLRGKRAEAIRKLEAFLGATRDRETAAIADCTITVWLLETGDRAAAAKRRACGFLANPQGASFPNPVMRAIALLLSKDFATTLPILRDLNTRAAPSPIETSGVMLAWALVETGNFEEAGKHLQFTPTPTAPAPAPFESLIFPRIFHLRAVVAEKKGDRAEAERNERLYRTLSGSNP